MFMVGNVSEEAQELCRITKHSLDEAIKICGPGVPVREVGKVSMTAAASNAHWFLLTINEAFGSQPGCTWLLIQCVSPVSFLVSLSLVFL